ncbi:MAG: hypothetical protein FJ272_15505 [Planctomycetes bacterium]|nr:hypothetical protein [Planctomycetota bacterium]
MDIVWTEYMQYRTGLRGFDRAKLEDILRYSTERYWDTQTQRAVVVGRHDNVLVLMPYETEAGVMTPITVHATTRQQIRFRLRIGRFRHE